MSDNKCILCNTVEGETKLEKIYEDLNLKQFDKNKDILKNYIASQSHIKSSKYKIDSQQEEHIYQLLKDTINRWQYSI